MDRRPKTFKELLQAFTSARQLMAISAVFSMLGMAAGLNALAGGHAWIWAIPASGLLLRLQFLIAKASGTRLAGGGGSRAQARLLAALSRGIYGVLMALAMCLAVAGVTELTASGRMAQKNFEVAAAQVAPQIERVESSFSKTAEGLDSLAAYSLATSKTEVAVGNTCSASDTGPGPFQRRRQSDAATLTSAAAGFQAKAVALRNAKLRADNEIANYTVARHTQVATAVNQALTLARVQAQSGALGGLEGDLRRLRDDNLNGSIDALTGKRVVCVDQTLAKRLDALLATPKVVAPTAVALPLTPTHETVIRGFMGHLGAVMRGETAFDFEVYGFALLGVVPELSLILGMLWRKLETRDTRGPMGGAGIVAGAPDDDPDPAATLAAAAAEASRDPLISRFSGFVVRDSSARGWVEYFRIPANDAYGDLRLIALTQVNEGRLIDKGIWPAGHAWTRFAPAPADPDALAHFFMLKPGEWSEMQLEALRTVIRRNGGKPGPNAQRHAAE